MFPSVGKHGLLHFKSNDDWTKCLFPGSLNFLVKFVLEIHTEITPNKTQMEKFLQQNWRNNMTTEQAHSSW